MPINAEFIASFLYSVIRITTPLLFGAMGALICKQGGVLHIAFEACMLFAAFFGMAASAFTQSLWVGLLAGMGGGVLLMLALGYFTYKLDANITLTGIALNTLASGGTVFLMYLMCGEKGASTSLPSLVFPNIDIPLIKDIPLLGQVLSGHNILTYVAFILPIFVYILIFKTPLGLRIRTVGENENAAASVGINVNRTKYITLAIGGAVTSLGGIFMSMGYLSWFAPGHDRRPWLHGHRCPEYGQCGCAADLCDLRPVRRGQRSGRDAADPESACGNFHGPALCGHAARPGGLLQL